MGWLIVEWLFEHPVLLGISVVGAVGLFFLWLFGPISWRNSEGSVVRDGESFADICWRLFDS